jgi:hypothetical protein
MQAIVNKFKTLKGAKFVTLGGYRNSQGEVANHNINCNISVANAKKADLKTLNELSTVKLQEIAAKVGADIETANKALTELIQSKTKNLEVGEGNTNQSKGQQNAYINIGKGLKLKPTNSGFDLYVTGFANSKTVLVEGEPKKAVNSALKTLVKQEIERGLKMRKYRTFKIENAGSLNITGDTIQLG